MESPRFTLKASDPYVWVPGLVQIELDGEPVENVLEACPGDPGWIAHIAVDDEEGSLQPIKILGVVRVLVCGVEVRSKVGYAQRVNEMLGPGAYEGAFWRRYYAGYLVGVREEYYCVPD